MTSPTGNDRFGVTVWGARGSLPVCGRQFAEFGGSTTCIEVRCGEHVLLFDAGSGVVAAGKALLARGQRDFTLLFSHCHYDHIIGLPFFAPLFTPDATVRLMSGHLAGQKTTQQMVLDFMASPFFPVGPEVCPANVELVDFVAGDVLTPYPGVTLRTIMLHHPDNAIGYRVEWNGRALAMVFDTNHDPDTLAPSILELISGVELFFYDATYTDDEYPAVRYFGHSTWQQGVRLAQAAGAHRVGFMHHALTRTDADLLQIEAEAKAQFPGAFCAREGQTLDL